MVFGKKKKEAKRIDPEEYEEDAEEFVDDEDEIEEVVKPVRKKMKKQSRDKWEVVDVPVQTQRGVYNTETEETLGIYEALVEILNRTE